jgi:hypothetical protein
MPMITKSKMFHPEEAQALRVKPQRQFGDEDGQAQTVYGQDQAARTRHHLGIGLKAQGHGVDEDQGDDQPGDHRAVKEGCDGRAAEHGGSGFGG